MADPVKTNGHTSTYSQSYARQRRVKTPTVHEALPYTPFSSILPFDPSIIPPPSCAEVSPVNAALAEKHAAQNARSLLTQLSQGAERAETASDQCQRTLRDVRKLLQTNATSHFTFRKPVQHSPDRTNGDSRQKPILSSFAQAVLQSQPVPVIKKQTELYDTIHVAHKPSVAVNIPTQLDSVQKSQFRPAIVDGVESNVVVRGPTSANVVDARAKGEAAVRDLDALLADIFTALRHEQSGQLADPFAPSLFAEVEGEDGSVLTLSPATQARVDASLRRVIVANRLEQISVSNLKHLQTLCEPSVRKTLDIQVVPDATEDAIEDWQGRLMDVDSSLVAVRILLRTMTGATRELRSESLVRAIVDSFKHVANSIVPIVELRPKVSADQSTFSTAAASQKQLLVVVQDFGKALRLLISLLAEVDLDESAVSGVMYTCRTLLFADNASSDRESVLGVQNFEALRRLTMDVVIKLFQRHADQRLYIINELISSLEKLPPGKQSARQFRLPDSRPIQLLSALFMHLVQFAAVIERKPPPFDSQGPLQSNVLTVEEGTVRSETTADISERLRSIISDAETATKTYANHIISSLVQRASMVSKSSDEPHRKLLDIFVEDFSSVLGLPGWPAAELLLQFLFRHVIAILKDNQRSVPVRNFALELLSRLAAGTLNLRADLRAASLPRDESIPLPHSLELALQNSSNADTALLLGGSVYEHLLRAIHDQAEAGCKEYHQLRWAQLLLALHTKHETDGDQEDQVDLLELQKTCETLYGWLTNDMWLERHAVQDSYSTTSTALASKLLTLNTDFAKSVPGVAIKVLHESMRSDHVTERSQALRSISTIIDMDAAVLDQYPTLLKQILGCMEDTSPQVRDAAMNLVMKCLEQRPGLGAKIYESISLRCTDTSANVRKRAMKVLREVYVREESGEIRANSIRTIVSRAEDNEESVAGTAVQILQDILFRPLMDQDQRSARRGYLALARLLTQVVEVVDLDTVLERSLIVLLQRSCKDYSKVLRGLVTTLFDGVVAPEDFDSTANTSQALLLRMIAIIVEADPKLLEPKQLLILEPYLQNLTDDDLPIFCMALAVLRHGISRARGLPKDFLSGLQTLLIKSLGKLGEAEVSAVAVCLAAINTELGPGNTEKLVKVQVAALKALNQFRNTVPIPDDAARKTQRLLHMAGQFGQACDFQQYLDTYRSVLRMPQALTVTALCVELFSHFTSEQQPLAVRQAAFSAICAIAQRSPRLFLDVVAIFDQVIRANDRPLIKICLEGMLTFFQSQEKNTYSEDMDATGRERLASTYVATDQDGAAAGLSQHYLPAIIQLACGSTDDLAMTATSLMASIVKQGLPHPKECGPALIALETSPNDAIAQLAADQHRMLHDKHETIIEKEYMRSMEQALTYQLTTVRDAKGYSGHPPVAKLHHFWTILKGGKAKVRQKFIVNLCQKLSFDPVEVNTTHLAFVRFIAENIACFDFDRMEDLRALAEQLGSVFAAVGASVAQAIDTHINRISIDSMAAAESPAMPLEVNQLQRLSRASQVLTLIAEARDQLVRIWGSKVLQRDKGTTGKAPTRSVNAATLTEAFLARTAELAQPIDVDEKKHIEMCQRFMDVMNVDSEARVGSGDDPEGSDEDGQPRKRISLAVPGTPSGRKRKSVDRQSGPKKRARDGARRSLSAVSKQTDEQDSDGDWP